MAQDTPSTSQLKKIVVLGGSYGGISVAHYVLKHALPKLPDPSSYQVVLVSPSAHTMCRPACPRALISDDLFDQKKLFVEIPPLFEQYPKGSFNFIQGTATQLDHTGRTVSVSPVAGDAVKIDFHALVITTGASTPSPLLSLNKDKEYLHSSWTTFRESLSKAKTIVIGGGGPAGIETAGELGDYLNGRAGRLSSKLANPKVAITVVTASSQILPVLRPSIAKSAEDLLAKVGVSVIKKARVQTVTPEGSGTDSSLTSKTTVTLDNGTVLEADLYIPATGIIPNTSFIDTSLLAEDKRVNVNASTLRVDKAGPRIYAVGDASTYARPAVHLLLEAIPVLGANIKRDLLLAAGQESKAGKDRQFKEDRRETHMVPIGKSKGVGAAMGYRVPSFLVWLMKGRDYWLWTTGDLWSGKQWAKE